MSDRHRHRGRARACLLAICLLLAGAAGAEAQFTEPPPPAAYALRNVTVVQADGSMQGGRNVVIRAGRIESIGAAAIPPDARVLPGDTLYVYPGLVDAAGTIRFEFPRDTTDRSRVRAWDPPRSVQGFMPSRRVYDHLNVTGADGADLRKKGVVAVAVHPGLTESLMPGRGALLLLRRDATTPQQLVLEPELPPLFTLRGARGAYPGTGMGAVAWYRQTLLDAQRQTQLEANGGGPFAYDPDLRVLQELLRSQGRVYIAANDADEIRRALALAAEFRLRPVIVGGTEAWRVAQELRAGSVPVLINVDFTKPRIWKPDEKPKEGEEPKPLAPNAAREKKQLEEAYANAAQLARAGVTFALVSGGRADLREGARKAVEYGLAENDALRALTLTPATVLGVPQLAGIRNGGAATFIVTDGPLLAKDTRILYTFVDGVLENGAEARRTAQRDTAAAEGEVSVAGEWEVTVTGEGAPDRPMPMTLTQTGSDVSGTITTPEGSITVSGELRDGRIRMTGTLSMGAQQIPLTFEGTASNDEMSGRLLTPLGDLDWTARRPGDR